MFNQNSINQVNMSMLTKRLKKPLYETYCFNQIPNTVKRLLGATSEGGLPGDVVREYLKDFDRVILFLIDGMGWNSFESFYDQSQFLTLATKQGVVSKLTTQFPTSTTGNLTTLHTGSPIHVSGILEWYMYEPVIDDVYCPFLYTRAKDQEIEVLQKLGVKAETILPHKSLYEDLKNEGHPSYIFQNKAFNHGGYSNFIQRHANVVDIDSLEDGLKKLDEHLKQEPKGFVYFYHPDFDKNSHQYGPYSDEAKAELVRTFNLIDAFIEHLPKDEKTVVLLTADHGQTTVIPENAIYINRDIPEVMPFLKLNKQGEPIIPCGSFRNFFLHIKEGHIDDVLTILNQQLSGIAEVFTINYLIEEGIFGSDAMSKQLLERAGDIVILPYPNQAVWWYQEGKHVVKHLGQHGGLMPEEIEIPFIFYPLA